MKIEIITSSYPICGDGCCHEESFIVRIGTMDIEFGYDYMHLLDEYDKLKIFIKELFGLIDIDAEIEIIEI